MDFPAVGSLWCYYEGKETGWVLCRVTSVETYGPGTLTYKLVGDFNYRPAIFEHWKRWVKPYHSDLNPMVGG